MPNELIRPIDEATAKALAEASKALGKVADLLSGTGAYAASVVGRLPHNLLGLLGDQVFHTRRMRAVELDDAYLKRLRDRHVEPVEISPSIAIPLLEAAIDETREVLKELWERLLANAADPTRRDRVRLSYIEILKKFDPIDASILRIMGETTGALKPNAREFVASSLNISTMEVMVSFQALEDLRCLWHQHETFNPMLTDRGRLILAAVAA